MTRDDPRAASDPRRTETCPCVKRHGPEPAYLQDHHILPKSWGGSNDASNRILICGTTHDATHDLMNLMVRRSRAGQSLTYAETRSYPRLARELAERAWREYRAANDGRTPVGYTLARPGEHEGISLRNAPFPEELDAESTGPWSS